MNYTTNGNGFKIGSDSVIIIKDGQVVDTIKMDIPDEQWEYFKEEYQSEDGLAEYHKMFSGEDQNRVTIESFNNGLSLFIALFYLPVEVFPYKLPMVSGPFTLSAYLNNGTYRHYRLVLESYRMVSEDYFRDFCGDLLGFINVWGQIFHSGDSSETIIDSLLSVALYANMNTLRVFTVSVEKIKICK